MVATRVIAISTHPRVSDRVAFNVDFATGEISDVETTSGERPSSFARSIQRAHADFAGRITFPWQQSYPAKPPLNDPQSLAWLLLSRGYRLEGDLAAFAPPVPDPTEPGTFN